jgi:hypothetical protein
MELILTLSQFLNSKPSLTVDEKGLPIVDYGRRLGRRVGRKYNPTAFGIVGLRAIRSAALVGMPDFDKTGEEIVSRISAAQVARWLAESSIDRGGYNVFHFNYPWAAYLLRPPWRSCLAEAFGGMFLVTYGNVKQNEHYVNCGLQHLRSLLVPVSKGGLKSDSSSVLLEYVSYEKRKRWPFVLNGHLYSLVTLFRAWAILGIPEFRAAFDEGVSELETLIPTFEGAHCTYYDDFGNPATLFYHRVHVHLLERLFELTKCPYLSARAHKWRRILEKYDFSLSLLTRAYTLRIPYLPRR